VQKVAAADDPDNADSHALAASDPEAWWAAHGDGDLGYSSLLAAVAPSSAARQGLLAEYFVATDEDRANGLKEPTAGHHAIAELVKSGWIRVIITTNFDRLMEQALDAVGVAYQVISRPDAAAAATPIAHATATVIKLHGDWSDLESRNTLDELTAYPQPWIDLLRQVFNEYGLLITGWSAEWDKALVRVMESTPRRYPLYWDSRSSKSDVARNLLAQHGGHVVTAASADDLFKSISASVDALARLAETPLTTAMAVARLKRALPDPLRRIELRDMILDHTSNLAASLIAAEPTVPLDFAALDAYLDTVFELTKPTMTLLVQGVRYDDGTHTGLWVEALQAVLDRRTSFPNLRTYAAALMLRVMSVEAVRQRRDTVLVHLLTLPHWDDPLNPGRSTVAADVLNMLNVIDGDVVNRLPRWGNNGWLFPQSHLLATVLADFFSDNDVDGALYGELVDDVEYRTGLVQWLLPTVEGRYRHSPNAGEFVIESKWKPLGKTWDDTAPAAEIRFLQNNVRDGSAAWEKLLNGRSLVDHLETYREQLKKYVRYR
jgi:hypothetical protein